MPKFVRVDRGQNDIYWWELIDNQLHNRYGGHCNIFHRWKILEIVEADTFEELDWSKTLLNQPDLKTGWLDREGRFYGCPFQYHDQCATLLLKTEVGELERTGWIRVCENKELQYDYFKRLTAEQRNWLSKNGFPLEDWE